MTSNSCETNGGSGALREIIEYMRYKKRILRIREYANRNTKNKKYRV